MTFALLGDAGLGLTLGAVTGLPLGVVNVAVVELARRDRRAAIGVGLGGALADTVHAGLAFAGLTAALLARPTVAAVLALASGVIVLAYAVTLARPAVDAGPVARPIGGRGLGRGLALGVSLTLPNPGALAAWVTVAAALAPRDDVTPALVTALAVGVGSASWFTLLAVLAARGRDRGATPRRLWPRRLTAGLLLALAALAIVRGALALSR